MRRILERSGYVVLEAEHGAQALEQCESHAGAIDLVVSDIVMPTMGGQEMAGRLRELRPNSRLLFVSGFTDDEVMQQGIILPGSAYLQKPFSPASLVAKIGEMLREPARGPASGNWPRGLLPGAAVWRRSRRSAGCRRRVPGCAAGFRPSVRVSGAAWGSARRSSVPRPAIFPARIVLSVSHDVLHVREYRSAL